MSRRSKPSGKAQGGRLRKFSETAWFRRGSSTEAVESIPDHDTSPDPSQYEADQSLSDEERRLYSLRSATPQEGGHEQLREMLDGGPSTGERAPSNSSQSLDTDEHISEMLALTSSRRNPLIYLGAAGVLAGVVFLVVALSGSADSKSGESIESSKPAETKAAQAPEAPAIENSLTVEAAPEVPPPASGEEGDANDANEEVSTDEGAAVAQAAPAVSKSTSKRAKRGNKKRKTRKKKRRR